MSGPELAATAERMRNEAELVELIGNVLATSTSVADAAGSLCAVAGAKRTAAELLDEMAREQS
jgi:hypothetical protein